MPRIALLLSSLALTLLLVLSSSGGAGASQATQDAAAGRATPARPGRGVWDRRPARAGAPVDAPEFVAGEVLVKFRSRDKADALAKSPKNGRGVLAPANDRALAALLEKHAVDEARQPFSRSRSAALRRVLKLTTRKLKGDPRGTEELVAELRRNPEVEYAEPNYLVRTQWTPNDPYFASSGAWGQSFRDLWGLEKIGAEAAWDLTRGAGVVVAVIDSGVDYGHEDLAANMWQNAGETGTDSLGRDRRSNGADDDGNGYVDDWRGWDFVTLEGTPADNDPMDDHGHGTHVAGTVAAVGDNQLGVVGVAPESRVMALKGLSAWGSGSMADLSEAIVYASDNGAKVINASWGGLTNAPIRTLTDAVAYAQQKDVVFVAAAGNSAADVGTPAAGFTPANIKGAVTVSAFNHEDARASFSNFGQKIDVAAPGGGDTDPNGTITEPRYSILSLASSQGSQYRGAGYLHLNDRYLRLAGTSMAAPHVAGVAALVRALRPDFSAEQVRQALRLGSDDTGAPGFDQESGYGRLNAAGALRVNLPLGVNLAGPVETLTGVEQVDVRGTVNGDGLTNWRLEYRSPSSADGWTLIHSSSAAVVDATLATWDISSVGDGRFELRVLATNSAGQTFADTLPVLIDNVFIKDPPPDRMRVYRPDPAFPISGTVTPSNLSGYTLSVEKADGRPLENPRLTLAGGGAQKVRDGLLGTWDSTGVAPGSYRITLSARLAGDVYVNKSATVIIEPSIHEGSPAQLPISRDGVATYALADHLVAADVDGDGGGDIVVGYGSTVGVYDHAGRMLPGWPQSVDPAGYGARHQKSPAVGDLDGDGRPEVVSVVDWNVFVWRADGTPLPGWPRPLGTGDPAYVSVTDVNGDGANELVMLGSVLQVVDRHGELLPGWPRDLYSSETPGFFVDFVVCDLDADGQKEIVARVNDNGTSLHVYGADGEPKAGWPRRVDDLQISPAVSPHPAAGDLDGDGDLEIVTAASDGRVHAYQHDGTVVAGWPQQTTGLEANSPAVGDIDGDGRAEVVVGSWGIYKGGNNLFAWRGDGTPLPGWPVRRPEPFNHSFYGFGPPVLADVDGDGAVDVVASGDHANNDEVLFAYRRDGSLVAGFPKHAPTHGAFPTTSPLVADLDGDGLLELAWVDYNHLLYVWDLPASRNAPAPWPMYRHDAALTGASPPADSRARATLGLGGPAFSASEAAGGVQFTVTRTGDGSGAVSVSYATQDGTALAGTDYTATTGTVTFGDGDTAPKTVTVTVADDALDEEDKTLTLTLSAPTGGALLGSRSTAVLTISDDDPEPSMSVGDVSVTEGDGGTAGAAFNVTLSAASARLVSVTYATQDGTAAAGSDYTAASGTLIFNPGETTKTVSVNVNGDALFEPGETFFLNLASPAYATAGDAQGAATITNDDPAPVFTITGKVVDAAGGQPLPGAAVTLSGAQSATTVADGSGNYSFTNLAFGAAYTVTPTKESYTFAPASRSFAFLASDQAANFSGAAASSSVNYALASNGATAAASSTFSANRTPLAVINGDRRGIHWDSDPATGSGWTDATQNAFPDWVEVTFAGPRSIGEVNVFTVQDSHLSPSEPTEAMTFTKYGATAFRVEYWTGSAWAQVPNGLVASNRKVWVKVAFSPLVTTKVRVVVTGGMNGVSRLTEVEAWGTANSAPAPPPQVNHALSANGATAAASSTLDAGRHPSAAINGDRKGLHWGSDPSTGSGWTDSSGNAFPDRLEVSFGGARMLNEISVFGLQDAYFSPQEPTEGLTSAGYALQDFDVEHWDGSAWVGVPGGVVRANDRVWRKLNFPALTTTKIRVVVRKALGSYSRVVELEAWGPAPATTPPPPRTNHALSSNGATAAASSTLAAARAAAAAINGDRRGLHWGSDPSTGSGWTDATNNAFPDWIEVRFAGARTIQEVSVFGLQDDYASPVEPTEGLTSTAYALQDFDVEYWTGTAWALAPGGRVTGNDRVWRKLTFDPLTTTKLRVVVRRASAGYSRVAEIEAY